MPKATNREEIWGGMVKPGKPDDLFFASLNELSNEPYDVQQCSLPLSIFHPIQLPTPCKDFFVRETSRFSPASVLIDSQGEKTVW